MGMGIGGELGSDGNGRKMGWGMVSKWGMISGWEWDGNVRMGLGGFCFVLILV